MSVVPALMLSVPTTITQNVVYALPARNVRVQGSAALEVSLDGTNFIALTGSALIGGVETAANFVRCTSGNCIVSCKAT